MLELANIKDYFYEKGEDIEDAFETTNLIQIQEFKNTTHGFCFVAYLILPLQSFLFIRIYEYN